MVCNFCGNPAAHPATGCQYGPNTLACAGCVRECWAWVRSHTNKKARKGTSVVTAESFYEAAGRKE